jgi:hypothetical protein
MNQTKKSKTKTVDDQKILFKKIRTKIVGKLKAPKCESALSLLGRE